MTFSEPTLPTNDIMSHLAILLIEIEAAKPEGVVNARSTIEEAQKEIWSLRSKYRTLLNMQ